MTAEGGRPPRVHPEIFIRAGTALRIIDHRIPKMQSLETPYGKKADLTYSTYTRATNRRGTFEIRSDGDAPHSKIAMIFDFGGDGITVYATASFHENTEDRHTRPFLLIAPEKISPDDATEIVQVMQEPKKHAATVGYWLKQVGDESVQKLQLIPPHQHRAA